jgi:hypothetical protein
MCPSNPKFNAQNFSSVAQQKEYESWLAKVHEPMEVDNLNENSNSLPNDSKSLGPKDFDHIERLGKDGKKKMPRKYTCNEC